MSVFHRFRRFSFQRTLQIKRLQYFDLQVYIICCHIIFTLIAELREFSLLVMDPASVAQLNAYRQRIDNDEELSPSQLARYQALEARDLQAQRGESLSSTVFVLHKLFI